MVFNRRSVSADIVPNDEAFERLSALIDELNDAAEKAITATEKAGKVLRELNKSLEKAAAERRAAQTSRSSRSW